MIWDANELQIRQLKEQFGIYSQLTISFTVFESGSRNVLVNGSIEQNACGEITRHIRKFVSGSYGVSWIRLIYTDYQTKEPTIKCYKYEHNNTTNPTKQNSTTQTSTEAKRTNKKSLKTLTTYEQIKKRQNYKWRTDKGHAKTRRKRRVQLYKNAH